MPVVAAVGGCGDKEQQEDWFSVLVGVSVAGPHYFCLLAW